jgi:hypothetical protein
MVKMELVFQATAAMSSRTFLLHEIWPKTEVSTSTHQVAGIMMTLVASLNPKEALQTIRQYILSHVQKDLGHNERIKHLHDHAPTSQYLDMQLHEPIRLLCLV